MSPNVDPTGSCQLLTLCKGGGGAWFSRLGQLGEEPPHCLLRELQPEPKPELVFPGWACQLEGSAQAAKPTPLPFPIPSPQNLLASHSCSIKEAQDVLSQRSTPTPHPNLLLTPEAGWAGQRARI